MQRAGRIIALTLGLSVVGAVFGALAGAIALALSLAIGGSLDLFSRQTLQLLAIPAVLGSIVGAIGAPAMAWLLLRHVPLGKAVAWSTFGTVAGGVVGWTLAVVLHDASPWLHTAMGDEVKGAILGAVLGFLATAIMLRRRTSRGRQSAVESQRPAA